MKKILIPVIAVLIGIGGMQTYSRSKLQSPLNTAIASDARNKGIKASASYASWISKSDLEFDITEVSGNNNPTDVFRVFLQYAETQKDQNFNRVILAYKGKRKFMIEGSYFKTLGQEYEGQNPMYTIRTFPEHVYDLSGKRAFGTWKGGMLGVVNKQMEDFNEFHKEWYVREFLSK